MAIKIVQLWYHIACLLTCSVTSTVIGWGMPLYAFNRAGDCVILIRRYLDEVYDEHAASVDRIEKYLDNNH